MKYYFYPRSPCGERPTCRKFTPTKPTISIHALLAESDLANLRGLYSEAIFLSTLSLRRATKITVSYDYKITISIHALLAESDFRVPHIYPGIVQFLSTLSLRRATPRGQHQGRRNADFYPRSPCGERQNRPPPPTSVSSISIHALLAESDGLPRRCCRCPRKFLSTLSLRRATAL